MGRGTVLGHNEGQVMAVGNEKVQKGISTHPPANGSTFVEWVFEKPQVDFASMAAINHTGIGGIRTPLVFKIIGDGKVLWTSDPIGKGSTGVPVSLSLPNVKTLRLEVECPGSHHAAHDIWVDPRIR